MDTPPPPAREASVHFPDDGLAEALGMDSDPFSKEIMEIQRHLRSISRGKGRLKVAASDVSEDEQGEDGMQSMKDELNQIDSAFDLERAIMDILSTSEGSDPPTPDDSLHQGAGPTEAVPAPPPPKMHGSQRRRSSMSELRDLLIGTSTSPPASGQHSRRGSLTVQEVLKSLRAEPSQSSSAANSPNSTLSKSTTRLRPVSGAGSDDEADWSAPRPIVPSFNASNRRASGEGTPSPKGKEQDLDRQITEVLLRAKQRRGSMHEMPERSHVELVKALLVATNQYDQALEAAAQERSQQEQDSRVAWEARCSALEGQLEEEREKSGRLQMAVRAAEEEKGAVERMLRAKMDEWMASRSEMEKERAQVEKRAKAMEGDVACLQSQVRLLEGANTDMRGKLREAERRLQALSGEAGGEDEEGGGSERVQMLERIEELEAALRASECAREREVQRGLRTGKALDHEMEERLRLASEVARLNEERRAADATIARLRLESGYPVECGDEDVEGGKDGEVKRLQSRVAQLLLEKEAMARAAAVRDGAWALVRGAAMGGETGGPDDDKEMIATLLEKVGQLDARQGSLEAEHADAVQRLRDSRAESQRLSEVAKEAQAAAKAADQRAAELEGRCEELSGQLHEAQLRLDQLSLGVPSSARRGEGGGEEESAAAAGADGKSGKEEEEHGGNSDDSSGKQSPLLRQVSSSRHSYSRIFASLVNVSVDGQDILTQLDSGLKNVVLGLVPSKGGDESDMYGQLTQCMSLNLEALDRFDWITAQLQEVQKKANAENQRISLRRQDSSSRALGKSGSGVTVVIQSSRQALTSVFWLDRVFMLEVESGGGGNRWTIERSLSEFRALWSKLQARQQPSLDFPPEQAELMSEEVLKGVEAFLASLAGYPVLAESREVLQFLVT